MSSSQISHVVSLFSYKPKKDLANIQQKQKDALQLAEGAPGYKGWKFEGVAREAPDTCVRCVEWESVEVSHNIYPS
jgi:hypothetical protein